MSVTIKIAICISLLQVALNPVSTFRRVVTTDKGSMQVDTANESKGHASHMPPPVSKSGLDIKDVSWLTKALTMKDVSDFMNRYKDMNTQDPIPTMSEAIDYIPWENRTEFVTHVGNQSSKIQMAIHPIAQPKTTAQWKKGAEWYKEDNWQVVSWEVLGRERNSAFFKKNDFPFKIFAGYVRQARLLYTLPQLALSNWVWVASGHKVSLKVNMQQVDMDELKMMYETHNAELTEGTPFEKNSSIDVTSLRTLSMPYELAEWDQDDNGKIVSPKPAANYDLIAKVSQCKGGQIWIDDSLQQVHQYNSHKYLKSVLSAAKLTDFTLEKYTAMKDKGQYRQLAQFIVDFDIAAFDLKTSQDSVRGPGVVVRMLETARAALGGIKIDIVASKIAFEGTQFAGAKGVKDNVMQWEGEFQTVVQYIILIVLKANVFIPGHPVQVVFEYSPEGGRPAWLLDEIEESEWRRISFQGVQLDNQAIPVFWDSMYEINRLAPQSITVPKGPGTPKKGKFGILGF